MYKFDQENHIHTLDGKPLIGTSSMASVLAKGGLTYWASGLAVAKFGWIHPGDKKKGFTPKEERLAISTTRKLEVEKLSPEEYLSLLDEAYKAHASTLKTSAKGGTDMHAELESYIKFILGLDSALSWIILVARNLSRLCTRCTLLANLVRNAASSTAVSPPPTTATSRFL